MNKKKPNLFQRISQSLRQSHVHLTDNQSVFLIIAVVLLVLTNLAVLLLMIKPDLTKSSAGIPNSSQSHLPGLAATETPSPSATPLPELNPETVGEIPSTSLTQGAVIFSMVEEGYSHLFAFTPGRPAMLRLTNGQWDDIAPALDPTGQRLALQLPQEWLLGTSMFSTCKPARAKPSPIPPITTPPHTWVAG